MSRDKPNSTDGDSAKLTWAVGANGEMTHISEVENGLECKCTCPECDGVLIAKQGKIREHHFAHESGEECRHAVETALHRLAKEVLTDIPSIMLPDGNRHTIGSAATEQRFGGQIIPDATISIKGIGIILIEITVTHGVDDDKLVKIRKLGKPSLEIDLSSTPRNITREELKKIIADETTCKQWLYQPRRSKVQPEKSQPHHSKIQPEKRRKEMLLSFKYLPAGILRHVHGCPRTDMLVEGKERVNRWANPDRECKRCKHYRGGVDEGIGVICGGTVHF